MTDPILIPKKDADDNTPAFREAVEKANRLGVNVRHVTDADCIVAHDKRRDPEAYRDAKRCAELLGRQVAFADPAPRDTSRQEPGATHLETDSHFYLLPGKLTPREYQRLTTKARASGKEVVMLRSWDGAPQPIQDAVANPS